MHFARPTISLGLFAFARDVQHAKRRPHPCEREAGDSRPSSYCSEETSIHQIPSTILLTMFTDLPEGPSYIPRPMTDPSRREGLACESGDDLLKPPQRLSEKVPHRLLPYFDQPEGYAQQYDVQTIWHCAHYHVCYDPHDDHPCRYHIRSEADRLTLRV